MNTKTDKPDKGITTQVPFLTYWKLREIGYDRNKPLKEVARVALIEWANEKHKVEVSTA